MIQLELLEPRVVIERAITELLDKIQAYQEQIIGIDKCKPCKGQGSWEGPYRDDIERCDNCNSRGTVPKGTYSRLNPWNKQYVVTQLLKFVEKQ